MTKIFLDSEIFCARIQRCAIHLSNEVNTGFSLSVNNHQSRGVTYFIVIYLFILNFAFYFEGISVGIIGVILLIVGIGLFLEGRYGKYKIIHRLL